MKPPLRIILLLIVAALQGCATATKEHVSVKPEVRYQALPQYPFEMRRAGINGEVVVEFIVDRDGVPQEVRAVKSSSPEFAPAAVAAVQKWRFKPATVDGRPVNVRMAVPIVFNLNEEVPSKAPQPAR